MYISRELCLEHCDLQNPPEELRIHNQFQRCQVTLCKASLVLPCLLRCPPENISDCLCKHLGQQHPNLRASMLTFTPLFFFNGLSVDVFKAAHSFQQSSCCLCSLERYTLIRKGKCRLVLRLEQHPHCVSRRSSHFPFDTPNQGCSSMARKDSADPDP